MMVGKRAMPLVAMGMMFLVIGLLVACGERAGVEVNDLPAEETPAVGTRPTPEPTAVQEPEPVLTVQGKEAVPIPTEQMAEAETDAAPVESLAVVRKLVMLDPGHQRHGNNAPEAVGPDTREVKPKVSSGTVGIRTKKPEYVLNLEVSQLVKAELVKRGIEVAMTRESHEVDISNKQRAEMANEAGAALAVRIHADGDNSPKTSGFSVLYPSAASAALKPIAAESRQAAGFIAEQLKAATGTAGRGLSARSDLSGFNWSKVPVVLVELGFMTNPEEDERLSEAEYQQKLAAGIADGIERFLNAGSPAR
ncbi:N-acetylmuramoyl-L-alanine amidase [Paenibacillus sp. P36]|uniref:N-acetylmuramoyl-L-alanine amidase family protein n=1 Tax=Paenibacillus sp. P36 TaxID=3342538 RepID=UPI0038B3C6A8